MAGLNIIGERGYLGSYLAGKNLPNKDYVINCAGLVSVELAEEDPERSYISNVEVVKKIIKEYPNSKIIQFSSYYVYDEPGILCDEAAKTTDKYVYMRHKLMAERYALEAGGVCFRIGKLYGHPDIEKQNRLTECIIKSKGNMSLDDVVFNPTSLETVYDVIQHELMFHDLHGLYNLSDDGTVTHYDYGVYILRALGIQTIPNRGKVEKMFHNFGHFAMDISKIKKMTSIKLWTTRMDKYLSGVKNAG